MLAHRPLPTTLNTGPMSDAAFASHCSQYPDLAFESTAAGQLIISPPAFSLTGLQNAKIASQLDAWTESDGCGLALDSSAGFVLPNGARRSPDGSWVLKSRVRELTPAARRGFWHLCPDFVIELHSETDRLKALRAKMREYLEQGDGEGPVAGFRLELARVWDPLAD